MFALVITEVAKINKNGIKFIEMRKKFFIFFANTFALNFFTITKSIVKKGIKINICFIKKINGFNK